jgi:S1-C subfamily serine protease
MLTTRKSQLMTFAAKGGVRNTMFIATVFLLILSCAAFGSDATIVGKNPDGTTRWSDGWNTDGLARIAYKDLEGGIRLIRYPDGHIERVQLATTVITRRDPETGVERYYRIGPDNKAVEINFPGEVAPKGSNHNRDSPNSPAASGTGFFISPDGYLLTNYHVVSGSHKIVVRTGDAERPAKVVRIDAGNDLAVLKVEGNFNAIPLGDARAVAVGDSVMTIGYPNIQLQGSAPKFTKGEVSSLTGFQDDARLFQISVPIQPGNSGGPLVDDRGNAVGVTNAQLSALKMIATSGSIPQNVNYAVKISYAQLLLDSIPEIAAKLPKAHKDRGETSRIIDETQKAAALIVVWQ